VIDLMKFFLFLAAFALLGAAQQPANPNAPPPQQKPTNAPPGAATNAPPGAAGQTPSAAGFTSASGPQFTQGAGGPPVSLDLPGALQRARDYNAQFLTAGIGAALAHEDRVQAKASLFPTLNAFNQFIYTQGNGTPSGVFVANDGVHVYNEQAIIHADLFSVAKQADYRRAIAAEAAARARQDVAARGLVATVVQSYYGLVAAQRHETNARTSVDEAFRFVDITEKQERGGEVARADVIKARLQYQQRQRDLMDAETNTQKARIALGVILFPDLAQRFDITDDLSPEAPLPPLEEIESLARGNSPETRAAEAGLRQASAGIASAKAAYYPSLVVDYFYGIDANVFGIHGPDDRQNLGSVVQGTVTIPVWNWGATRSRIRQAELQQRQAQFDLTFTQRALQSNITGFYLEAQVARNQLESLRSSLDLSTESLRLTVLRYQAGEATALEVADAQTTLAQARNAQVDGLTRYRVALANLQILTGRF
jgi:outer membrane protein TolC